MVYTLLRSALKYKPRFLISELSPNERIKTGSLKEPMDNATLPMFWSKIFDL
jgi:hypothetical protein